MLKFFDAQLILTPKEDGMKGAMSKALSIKNKIKDSIILNQFENKANPHTHFTTTAKEIWDDCNGRLDCLISGVGTGGTITGIGKFLKKKNKKIEIVAVEPEDSPVISGGEPGPHSIQGIGAGFIPSILELNVIDKILSISSSSAFEYSRKLAKLEGIAGGISSGAVLAAAVELNEEKKNEREKYHCDFTLFCREIFINCAFCRNGL